MIIGYTTGVFDLFHVGHVKILKKAKSLCDKLIVGVSTDELVQYKGKFPKIPFSERLEVVQSCRYVDLAVPQTSMNKMEAYNRYKFNIMFVGDDWFNTEKWNKYEEEFREIGISIIYFEYTKHISSTSITAILDDTCLIYK